MRGTKRDTVVIPLENWAGLATVAGIVKTAHFDVPSQVWTRPSSNSDITDLQGMSLANLVQCLTHKVHTPHCDGCKAEGRETEEEMISPTSRRGSSTKHEKGRVGSENGHDDREDENTGEGVERDGMGLVVGDQLGGICRVRLGVWMVTHHPKCLEEATL